MSYKLFHKVTEIEGDKTSTTTPEFNMAENSAVVFLIESSEAELTITAKGHKGEETEKAIGFETKPLSAINWEEMGAEGLEKASDEAYLIAIPASNLAHDELESISLTITGDTSGKRIYAFEIAGRYKPYEQNNGS